MVNYQVTMDPKIKLVKNEWNGKPDSGKEEEALKVMEEGFKAVENELRKFNKGEPVLLVDLTNMDMRFLPSGTDKILSESMAFCLSYCKKLAQVVTSLMLEISLGKVQMGDNFKMFDSEREAMKWLLE